MAGQIAVIDNVPMSTFFPANGLYPNVDEIFITTNSAQRVSIDTLEVKYRPQKSDINKLRFGSAPVLLGINGSGVSTFPFETDIALEEPRVIGFVWRGLPTGTVVFDAVKVVEWVPQTGCGLSVPIPRQITESLVDKVTAYLDRAVRGWTTEHGQMAMQMLQRAQQMAQIGSALYMGTSRRTLMS